MLGFSGGVSGAASTSRPVLASAAACFSCAAVIASPSGTPLAVNPGPSPVGSVGSSRPGMVDFDLNIVEVTLTWTGRGPSLSIQVGTPRRNVTDELWKFGAPPGNKGLSRFYTRNG